MQDKRVCMKPNITKIIYLLCLEITFGVALSRTRNALLTLESIRRQIDSNEGHAVLYDYATCPEYLRDNSTLMEIDETIEYCPNPFYRLREIYPHHLIWSESDESSNQAEHENSKSSLNNDSANQTNRPQSIPETIKTDPKSDYFVGFLLYSRGDYFSMEMEEIVTSIAPAFPDVWFVRAEGSDFSRFTTQYMVRGFPRLLLFKAGKVQGQYAGERNVALLGAWLSAMINAYPKAVVLTPLKPPPPTVRWDDQRLWMSTAYIIINAFVLLYRFRPHRK